MQDVTIDYIVRNTTSPINLELPNIVRTGTWNLSVPVFNLNISLIDPTWTLTGSQATLRERAFDLESFIYRVFSTKIYLTGNIPSSSATESNGSPSNVLGSSELTISNGASGDFCTFTYQNRKDVLDREFAIFSGVTFLQLQFVAQNKVTVIPLIEETGYACKIVDTSTNNTWLCSPITLTLKFTKIDN